MIEREIHIEMDEILESVKDSLKNGVGVTILGCGDSMAPFIENGKDKIHLKRIPNKKKIRAGEIYFYSRTNGKYAIHRIYKVKKDFVLMLGDAQLFIEPVPKQNLIAIVTEVFKDDKKINCTTHFNTLRYAAKSKIRIAKYLVSVRLRPLLKFFKKQKKRVFRRISNLFRKN